MDEPFFDAVSDVPEGFTVVASTDVCPVAAMENAEKKIFTTQSPPGGESTPGYGQRILSNFLFNICGLEKNWTMDNLVESMTADFRETVGEDRVILRFPAALILLWLPLLARVPSVSR